MIKTAIRKTRLKEYKPLADRNLSSQQEFLEATVKAALARKKNVLTSIVVCQLNKRAVEFLCEMAGEYRRGPIAITNSNHKPPRHSKVRTLVKQCMGYLNRNWNKKSSMHLAAYALWKLGWIHPFMEGNGRTARAVCMLIICLKQGTWIPEKNLMPKKNVHGSRTRYYTALRDADEKFDREGVVDVSALEAYLRTLMFKGVSKSLLAGKKTT